MPEPNSAEALDFADWEQSVRARLRTALASLRPADARVMVVVLEDVERAIGESVTELARRADVSESTVVRACQRLGFSGFHDLKMSLAKESRPAVERVHGQLLPGDSAADVFAKIVSGSQELLQDSLESLDPGELDVAATALAAASRVVCVGLGTSWPIAHDAAVRLNILGLSVSAPSETVAGQLAASALTTGDVLVAVSHSGQTHLSLRCVEIARSRGATTLAITSFEPTPLTEAADISLIAGGREVAYRVEAISSRLVHLAVIDALYVLVAFADEDRSRAALARFDALSASSQI